jgi:hypothetical protein
MVFTDMVTHAVLWPVLSADLPDRAPVPDIARNGPGRRLDASPAETSPKRRD